MAYRVPAPPPPEPIAPATKPPPATTLYVTRYEGPEVVVGWAIAFGVAAVFALLSYGSSTVQCTRSFAGAEAQCAAFDRALLAPGEPLLFTLTPDAVRYASSRNDDGEDVWLAVPGGRLVRGVNAAFARRAEDEAKGFMKDRGALTWEVSRTSTIGAWVALLVALAVAAPLAAFGRKTRIELDGSSGVVRICAPSLGPSLPTEHPFSSFESAAADSIDDSEFTSLVLVRGDERTIVAQGRDAMVKAAVAAINRHKNGKRRGRKRG